MSSRTRCSVILWTARNVSNKHTVPSSRYWVEMKCEATRVEIWQRDHEQKKNYVIFEVFMAVTMRNSVFWDVMLFGSCKNGCFGENIVSIIMATRICELGTTLVVTSNQWRRYVAPKLRFLQEPHGATSQKTAFFNKCTRNCHNVTILDIFHRPFFKRRRFGDGKQVSGTSFSKQKTRRCKLSSNVIVKIICYRHKAVDLIQTVKLSKNHPPHCRHLLRAKIT
jgi:hypothetical protein